MPQAQPVTQASDPKVGSFVWNDTVRFFFNSIAVLVSCHRFGWRTVVPAWCEGEVRKSYRRCSIKYLGAWRRNVLLACQDARDGVRLRTDWSYTDGYSSCFCSLLVCFLPRRESECLRNLIAALLFLMTFKLGRHSSYPLSRLSLENKLTGETTCRAGSSASLAS